MGRKRAYAPLDVYMNGRRVGQYFRAPDGAFAFTYAPEWLTWENTLPISRTQPLQPERYTGPPVIAVLENLLPDSDLIRRGVAERVGADGVDAYSLLARIGRDCVGALQFLPEGEVPCDARALIGEPFSDAQIGAMLQDLAETPLGIRAEQDFRISVAVAQEKTALLFKEGQCVLPTGTTPTTHILTLGRSACVTRPPDREPPTRPGDRRKFQAQCCRAPAQFFFDQLLNPRPQRVWQRC
ncbi:MAG: HipA N-terminal domain-containing protein [Rhodobacterales bacterium]